MAKSRNTTHVRTRAIKAWFAATKIDKDDPHLYVVAQKARSRDTITVKCERYGNPVTWSYKGGSLKRIAIGA
jgi:hypothetical protein